MIVAVDVQYDDAAGRARAGAVVFQDWVDVEPTHTLTREHAGIAPYVPGQFLRRELPCIRPLIDFAMGRHKVNTIVIDGFVDLAPDRPGLGRHLARALPPEAMVIGVSKNPFRGEPGMRVLRGGSARPLWVTSTADPAHAARQVVSMAGPHRIPKLLRLADALARGHVHALDVVPESSDSA